MHRNEILKGVRILDLHHRLRRPYAGRLLAGYGAEVIKIESSKGGLDTFRHYGQHKDIDAAPQVHRVQSRRPLLERSISNILLARG